MENADKPIKKFIEELEKSGRLYMDLPIAGMTACELNHTEPEKNTILIDTDPEHHDRLRVESKIDACIDPDADELVEARLVHERSVGTLSRFIVKRPDYRPTRGDFRVETPPGVAAFFQVLRRDGRAVEKDDRGWQQVEVIDISVGGMGFRFDDEHDVQYGDILLVHIDVNSGRSFNIEGSVVYIHYQEEADKYQAGLKFLEMSDDVRRDLFNFLNRIQLDQKNED
jgi:hypothetical protein